MLTDRQQNYLTVQLNQAAIACDTERRLRVAAEQRALEARTLLLEMAQRLLPVELDDLRHSQAVAELPNLQFAHWLTDQLSALLFKLHSSSGHPGEQRLAHYQQENQKLIAELAAYDPTVTALRAEVGRLAGYPAAMTELESRVAALQAALAQCQTELERTRPASLTAADLSSPALAVTSVRDPARVPAASAQAVDRSALDWFETWLANTPAETLERQQRIIQIVAAGEAFFRSEIVDRLNATGIWRTDPHSPGGAIHRVISSLSDQGVIEELDSGYGPSVPRAVTLTDKGRAAFERLTGLPLPQTVLSRLLNRHKTHEHTVLNLLARSVLNRFGFDPIDLFPESRRTSDGSLVIPDIAATSPAGEVLLIECERLRQIRSLEERANKWGDLASITGGQLYVFVPSQAQQRDLISEISKWALETRARSTQLFICQYLKAIRPEATSPWTYTTSWSIPY
jgi:DNA-binding MarR family transcriptional regulator